MTYESAKMGARRSNVCRYPDTSNKKVTFVDNRANKTGRVDAAFHGTCYMQIRNRTPANMAEWSGIGVVAIVDVNGQRMTIAIESTIKSLTFRFAHHRSDGEIGSHDGFHR